MKSFGKVIACAAAVAVGSMRGEVDTSLGSVVGSGCSAVGGAVGGAFGGTVGGRGDVVEARQPLSMAPAIPTADSFKNLPRVILFSFIPASRQCTNTPQPYGSRELLLGDIAD